MARAFIAIPIPVAITDELVTVQNRFAKDVPGFHPISHEKFHITLKFLGEISETEEEKICQAVNAIHSQPFDLEINDSLQPLNADVIALSVKNSDALKQLASQIENACEKVGIDKEHCEYLPHVTIGKIRKERFLDSASLREASLEMTRNIPQPMEEASLEMTRNIPQLTEENSLEMPQKKSFRFSVDRFNLYHSKNSLYTVKQVFLLK